MPDTSFIEIDGVRYGVAEPVLALIIDLMKESMEYGLTRIDEMSGINEITVVTQ